MQPDRAQKRRKLSPAVNNRSDAALSPGKATAEDPKSSSGGQMVDPSKRSAQASPRVPNPTRASNGNFTRYCSWQYGTKKTFEDEIRELEEAARQEAEGDDKDTGPTAPIEKRRRTARRSPSKTVQSTPKSQPRAASENGIVAQRTSESFGHFNPDTPDKILSNTTEAVDDSPKPIAIASRVTDKPRTAPSMPILRDSKNVHTPSSSIRQTLERYIFQPRELASIQNLLLERATRKRFIPLLGLDEEYAKVSKLISQTVAAGESNSMLILGARGSGKTALVNQILCEQQQRHPHGFHTVRLNGLLQTDDKLALREIWRQLGRETDAEEDDPMVRSYADTMTSLLALLSHPADFGQDEPDHVAKSVIFILDEFELFTNHPRQTLLYNLFDIAQSRKAPIAVLGLTTRLDVAESLEKRVKSRFSQRYVHLPLAKDLRAFEEICKSALLVKSEDVPTGENLQLKHDPKGQQLQELLIAQPPLDAWNSVVHELFATNAFIQHLRRIYFTTKSVPEFLTSMLLPLATLPIDTTIANTEVMEHVVTAFSSLSLSAPDSKLDLLSSLNVLQLALLICAARLTAIYDSTTVSFTLVYEEYKALASKAKMQATASGALAAGAGSRVSSIEIARDAWNELRDCGLVLDDGRSGGRVDVGLEEIGMSGIELGSWARWCKEI